MKDNPLRPARKRVQMLARNSSIDLGEGNGSADDPTLHGGTVRIVSTAGDGFDATYPLPAAGWAYFGKAGAERGYNYLDLRGVQGPIRFVVVKKGRVVRIVGAGAGLDETLATNPDPVTLVLTIGEKTYCTSFGGTTRFHAGRFFQAKDAPAPATCPPEASLAPARWFNGGQVLIALQSGSLSRPR